jgi:hypothetical protein
VGHHARMVGHHKQERWVNMLRNLHQVLSIVIDLADSVTKRDSIYEPRKAEIEKYITYFTAGKNQKYNLRDIGYKQERRQAIIKKDAATILLYNIAPENYELFVECLKGFKFL